MEGLGARFALEAVFLIALAVGAGIAELSAAAIVVVMAVAWLVICLFELATWAERGRFRAFEARRIAVEEAPEPAAVTAIREPQPAQAEERRRRFWRRRRAITEERA